METYNVKSLENCACSNCEVVNAGIDCLALNLLTSPEGRILEKKTRWSDFQWEDTDRFEKHFGPDANNFWHGPHQAREIAVPFIESQNSYGEPFSAEDARLLITLNVVHDIQEVVTGDIPLPQKNQQTEAYELHMQRVILSRILNLPNDDGFLNRLIEVQQGDGLLSRAFKAIEYAGYLRTGLRAWASREDTSLEPDERRKCYELGLAVLTRNVQKMYPMADEFPYIGTLLRLNKYAIDEALAGPSDG